VKDSCKEFTSKFIFIARAFLIVEINNYNVLAVRQIDKYRKVVDKFTLTK
jgi:hypothetical protein